MSGNELEKPRREKLESLRKLGVDPYPAEVEPVTPISRLRSNFKEATSLCAAGRLMAIRSHGKAAFATLRDGTGEIQLYFQSDILGKDYEIFELLDLGDSVWVRGEAFTTKRGEQTINVQSFKLLAKTISPLPEKWHGLKDTEKRYRSRHLDLLTNTETKDRFIKRTKIIQAMRRFLDERGFTEVETPVLQPVYGGAMAKPFVTHHEKLDTRLYLRVSDELYLKRLIIGGLDRVYEIGHDFRNEGLDTSHNTEFTMLESYMAYAGYREVMELTEQMLAYIAQEVLGTTEVTYQGKTFKLDPPWKRITVQEAIKNATGIDIFEHTNQGSLETAVKAAKLEVKKQLNWGKLVDELLGEYVRPNLVEPTFIMDYPVEMSPLSKRKPGSDNLVERFEPFVGGVEVGDAWSELTDPDDQRERFVAQAEARRAGDEEALPLDEDWIKALTYGMPPTGGLGIGVDRLVMVLTDTPSIRDVILFPQLKPEN
jgi:lysyl-tRNA synthetase class 2